MEYTAEKVLMAYEKLSTSQTHLEQSQANQFIVDFVKTTQAWKIADEIISSNNATI
jgi:hypothetical protein